MRRGSSSAEAKCFVRGVDEGTAGRRTMRSADLDTEPNVLFHTQNCLDLHFAGFSPLFTTSLQEVVAAVRFPPKLSDFLLHFLEGDEVDSGAVKV